MNRGYMPMKNIVLHILQHLSNTPLRIWFHVLHTCPVLDLFEGTHACSHASSLYTYTYMYIYICLYACSDVNALVLMYVRMTRLWVCTKNMCAMNENVCMQV